MKEQYYLHTCKCGCGMQIEVKEYHNWYGIPLYIRGHSRRDSFFKFIEENTDKFVCRCGCNNFIKIKQFHKWLGIPNYISGHNPQKVKLRMKCLYFKCTNLVKRLNSKYCSHECYNLDSIIKSFKKHTEETKQKISDSHKGDKNPMYGKSGELSPTWQGGVSFEPYGLEFNKELKKYIKQRDMNTCQTPNCMNIERLHIHHIDYNKKNNNVDNLITLCINCHTKTNGKNNREFYTNYYSEVLTIYL